MPPVISETCLLHSKRLGSLDSSLEIRRVGTGRAQRRHFRNARLSLGSQQWLHRSSPLRVQLHRPGQQKPSKCPFSGVCLWLRGADSPQPSWVPSLGPAKGPQSFRACPAPPPCRVVGSFPGWTPVRTVNTMVLNVLVMQPCLLRPASGCASAARALSHFTFPRAAPRGSHTHCTDEDTETQGGEVTPWSFSQLAGRGRGSRRNVGRPLSPKLDSPQVLSDLHQ